MARMLGTWQKAWCPVHRRPAGLDCPDTSRGKKAQRVRGAREAVSNGLRRGRSPTIHPMQTFGITPGEAPKLRHQVDMNSKNQSRSLCGQHVVITPNATLDNDDCVRCLKEQMKRQDG